jgi:hypothetical protein
MNNLKLESACGGNMEKIFWMDGNMKFGTLVKLDTYFATFNCFINGFWPFEKNK